MGSSSSKKSEGAKDSGPDAGLTRVTGRVADRVGKIAVTGRYHRTPKCLDDDYTVATEVLGKGYNGSVYKATGKVSGHKFAVKDFMLRGVDKEKRDELEAECEIFLGMDHPHVVRLVDVYESSSKLSLVMECMAGGELFDRVLERKKFKEQDAANAAYQMLLSINYLHSIGVVHRDIKLENFLYESPDSDHLKLIDFGFSKLWSPDTRMKMSCGTLAYVAPEVLNKNYTSQCDMWSLGVVIFILLVGYMPFAGSESNQMQNIQRGNYTWKEPLWRKISEDGQSFIKGMLTVDPKARLTCEQALAHTWIADRAVKLERSDSSGLDEELVQSLISYSEASKFRRACMSAMAWSLTNAERAQVRDAFLAMDTSNGGTVTMSEFKAVLETHFDIADEQVKAAFAALDTSKDDQIHYSEFLAAMMTTRLNIHSDLLKKTFRRFDVDNSGAINPTDLKAVLGDTFEGTTVEALLAEADTNHDGKIDYEEFCNYVMNADAADIHKDAAGAVLDKETAEVATMKKKR